MRPAGFGAIGAIISFSSLVFEQIGLENAFQDNFFASEEIT
jgi:hypothetical protein